MASQGTEMETEIDNTKHTPVSMKDDATACILSKTCELIAPMTRIRGSFKLTPTSIAFIPDREQPTTSRRANEINLAMNPPPLYVSKATSPHSMIYKPIETQTINTFSFNSNTSLHSSLSSKTTDHDDKPELKTAEQSNSALSNTTSPQMTPLQTMVLSNLSNESNNEVTEYWIATNVCSSYQQVGGTRYRLMSAHRFWFIDELNEIYYRRYQLRNCAFELFFHDETSWFFNFYDTETRNHVFDAIMKLEPTNLLETVEFFQNPKAAIKSSQMHHKWCRREISNFEYLMKLNIMAGRTFNDLTQYPVLPWIITDFQSETIDLKDKSIYRDLAKPIGALDAERWQKFKERYDSLKEDEEQQLFMYGTHYSSIGNILYYLLRMQPFTTYNLKFQDGKFDHADRLFHSVHDCWMSCLKNTGDVKELIPEFFYLTDFLQNKQNLDLGIRQSDKIRVHDVELPPWAEGSAEKFIKIMRDALESEYVSNHLHEWIDLIFGYKQQGKEAELAFNVFHPYTYEGNVEIDEIADETERAAILSQIDEYGQTPMQLFTEPHPSRFKSSEVLSTIFKSRKVKYYSCTALTESADIGVVSLCRVDKQLIVIGSDYCCNVHKWNANKLAIEKQKSMSLSKLLSFGKQDKQNKIGGDISLKIIEGNTCFATTADGLFSFACGFEDNSFIIWDVLHSKVFEKVQKHEKLVSCLALDENVEKQKMVLVTGSYDNSVMVWRVNIRKTNPNKGVSSIDIQCIHHLENQIAPITCVDISLKSGIIVCCSLDGIVNVYNSSTGDHYHMLQPYVDKAMKERREKELQQQKELHLRKRSSLLKMYNSEAGGVKVDDKDKGKDEEHMATDKNVKSDECKSDNNGTEEQHEQKLENSPSPSPGLEPFKNGIESSVLTTVRVSDVFGYILCYSKQTKDLFLYSSNGKMIGYSSSHDDVYNDIKFSKSGNYIVCGGRNCNVRIKQLPSFQTRKKFKEAVKNKAAVTCIYLSHDENYMLVGTANGNVLVYSLPQKAFVEVRIGALGRHGF